MKTLSRVIRENPDKAKLIRAVIRRIGMESVQDVNAHGIDGGFNGFIYYTDTVKFYRDHKADILRLAKETAESLGEGGVITLVKGFRCLNGQYSEDEISEGLHSSGEDEHTIKNAMAWFAAEEVCRLFEE